MPEVAVGTDQLRFEANRFGTGGLEVPVTPQNAQNRKRLILEFQNHLLFSLGPI